LRVPSQYFIVCTEFPMSYAFGNVCNLLVTLGAHVMIFETKKLHPIFYQVIASVFFMLNLGFYPNIFWFCCSI